MLEYLNLRIRPVVPEYNWVDAKITCTSLPLGTEDALSNADIVDDDPSKWLVFSMPEEKRISSSSDDCMVPFYECLFTRIKLQLPFYELEVSFLKRLKIAPS